MIYDNFSEEQMALPVAQVNVKPGPTELGSGPRTQFQTQITQRFEAGEMMGCFHKRVSKDLVILTQSKRNKCKNGCDIQQRGCLDGQVLQGFACVWIIFCNSFLPEQLIFTPFCIQDRISIFYKISIKMQMLCFSVN